jgi:hypothetical protein
MNINKPDALQDILTKKKDEGIPLIEGFQLLMRGMAVIWSWVNEIRNGKDSSFDEYETIAMIQTYLEITQKQLDVLVKEAVSEKMLSQKNLRKVVLDNVSFLLTTRTTLKMLKGVSEEFVKVERKLDTVKVNKFIKENKKVPVGVRQVTSKPYLIIKVNDKEKQD